MVSKLRLISSCLYSSVYKFIPNKPRALTGVSIVLIVTAITTLGITIRLISNPTSSSSSSKIAPSTNNRLETPSVQSTLNPPLTKLREYVYAGGRLLSSEEKSCVPVLSPLNANITQGGGSGSIGVSTSSGCHWIATSNAEWISVTGASSGTGNGTVSYSVSANGGGQRSGTITINGRSFTITQAPHPGSCGYTLNKTSETISEHGGNGLLALTTGTGCYWTASSNASWLSITSASSGTSSATINYSVTANNDGHQRSSTISVGGQNFTVTQPPNQASCTFSLSPANNQFDIEGGSGSFNVTTGAGCHWSAASNVGWVTITGGAVGTGNGTVGYVVQSNNGDSRSSVVSVQGQSFTITQCGYQLSPNNASYNKTGGAGSFSISCASGCSWSAVSNASWLQITSGANGTGNGTVSYSVQFNSGDSRTGTISVKGKTFTVTQCSYQLSPAGGAFSSVGGNASFTVSTASYCSWSAVSDSWWIRVSPSGYGTGNGVVYYSVESFGNSGGASRSGSIYIGGMTFGISQYGAPSISKPIDNNQSGTDEPIHQLGILSLVDSDEGPKSSEHQTIENWQIMRILVRVLLILLLTCCVLIILKRRLGNIWVFVSALYSDIYLRLRSQFILFRTQFRLIKRNIAWLLLDIVEAITKHLLLLLLNPRLIRLKHLLRHALVIVIIITFILPARAQAEGVGYIAESILKSVSETVKYITKAGTVRRHMVGFSSALQSEQVTDLKICPKQLIMYLGEHYTLTPIPLNSSGQVVQGASMLWGSSTSNIAKVTSLGEVEAMSVGNTFVEVQSGNISKQIPIEVRSGTRPVGSNQESDIDISDCTSDQSSMYSSQPIVAGGANQSMSMLVDDGVQLDWDPEPVANSRAVHLRNTVGHPRFSPTKKSVNLGSYNYQFNAPVISVSARGINANINMAFNSRVWNSDNGKMTFNYVGAYPGPGWTMGFGKIIRNYDATGTGNWSGVGNINNPGNYLLITSDGTRIRLLAKYNATTDRWFHESDDGSFLQFNCVTGQMRYPDGNRTIYSSVNGILLPTAMIGANGDAITMSYRDYCEGASCFRVFRHRTALSAIRDTLGRYITFHYYGDNDYPADMANGKPSGELAAIKSPDMNGVQQEIIRVDYQPITLKYDFGNMALDAPAYNSQVQVVRRIYYPQTGKGYLFQDYSSYGMPRKISSRMAMTGAAGTITDGTEIAYTTYNYLTIDPSDPYGRNQTSSLSDFPDFTRREEWWLGKTDANGTPTTITTKHDYSRSTNSTTETVTIKNVDGNYEDVTTTGTDSNNQQSFGKVISVETKNSTAGAVLSKQINSYTTGPDGEVEMDKIETIDDAGQSKLVSFTFGKYGRVIDQYEYGYKQGADYIVQRRTHYNYVDDQSYINERFLRLVSRVSVYDAKNNNNNSDDELKAKTETIYDNYSSMGGMQNYGLNANLYPPNHSDEYNENKTIRGNVTGITTFSKVSSPEESTTRRMKYDIFGNVVLAELSCCVTRSLSFSSQTAYSQPYSIRSGNVAGLNLESTKQYNYFTGLIVDETNHDGHLTSYEYDTAFRLKKVVYPTGAVGITHVEQDSYGNDLLSYISQTTYDDDGTVKIITSKQWFDGGGHIVKAGTGTGDVPNSYDVTRTIYDSLGRVLKQSNPYAGDANGDIQTGVTEYWTTKSYDELSRIVQVKLPDNQVIQTNYNGATIIATDAVGRKRKNEFDGLGRLVKVTEQNPANSNLEWETINSYDELGNIIQVNQGGQIRTFIYDAKSRLLSETFPESGTTTYTYTDFDAVNTKTDAKGVVTTYTYGAMNLLTNINYDTTNASGVATTSSVNITYKNASPAKAQIETITTGTGSESYSYDNFGQLQTKTGVIDGISYETNYSYNAIGQMTLIIYPSGKRVKVDRDTRGRLSSIQKVDDSNSVQETYLSSINYRVDGQISNQQLGDGTTETFGYSNDRLQLTSQKVTKGSNELLNLSYIYQATAGQMGSGSTAGNSGQLVNITGTVNGQNRSQSFTYDNVGRLVTATGWGTWARRFDYDRYGNRIAVWDATTDGNKLQSIALSQNTGITTNRIASVTSGANTEPYTYDASGNLTSAGNKTLSFDALNRIVTSSVQGGGSENYSYNAANHRVRKELGGVVTHYIWEGNQIIAEYEYGGGNIQAIGTRYYHQDRLSTRVITDGTGNVVGNSDHLPFGEEIQNGSESEKHKFTSYERDSTELDYAVNRHYSSAQGRFTQVDPIGMVSVNMTNPQTMNLYAYTGNDPVNSIDPLGLSPFSSGPPIIRTVFLNISYKFFIGYDSRERPIYLHVNAQITFYVRLYGIDDRTNMIPNDIEPLKEPEKNDPAPENPPNSEGAYCRIEARARPVRVGGVPTSGYHAYILTTQSNQDFSTVFQGLHVTKNLTARTAAYDESAGYDYEKDEDVSVSEAVTKGGSCRYYNEKFAEAVDLTNSSNIKYKVGSTNSNAFVFTALKRAGLDTTFIGNSLKNQIDKREEWTVTPPLFPGWGTELPFRR